MIIEGTVTRKESDQPLEVFANVEKGRQNEGEAWTPGRKGYPPRLYVVGGRLEDARNVVVVDGKKNAESVAAFGCVAVSAENGANSWKDQYNEQLAGKHLVLIGDNDPAGQAYLDKVVRGMSTQAKSIRRLDLCQLWPELPRGGDVSDYIAHVGAQEAKTQLRKLMRETAPLTIKRKHSLIDLFRPLSEFEEEELEWLIPGWMPKGGVVIVAGDGGAGKTHLLANITAAVTKGGSCILGDVRQEDTGKVLFLNREDPVRKVLKRRLKDAGVKEAMTIMPDFQKDKSGRFDEFTLGSDAFVDTVIDAHPRMVVIDPLQSFLSDTVDMSKRNHMRQCMQPLVHLGEELGCTFLVLCHTNKQTTVSGRSRVADSSDLWDISRSLIMVGEVDKNLGLKYISQEKNSYAEREDTILFCITDSGVQYQGTTTKRDGDFKHSFASQPKLTKREQAKEIILTRLKTSPNGAVEMSELQRAVETAKISTVTLRRAREELTAEGKLQTYCKGNGRGQERKTYWRLVGEASVTRRGGGDAPLTVAPPPGDADISPVWAQDAEQIDFAELTEEDTLPIPPAEDAIGVLLTGGEDAPASDVPPPGDGDAPPFGYPPGNADEPPYLPEEVLARQTGFWVPMEGAAAYAFPPPGEEELPF